LWFQPPVCFAIREGELEHLELHESLFVVYAESSLVGGGVAVVVAEIEAVGVRPDVEQLLLLLLLGYSV
jgi:hypothetical protein